MPANYYMPYGGQAGICSVPVEWAAMSFRCLAGLRPGAAKLAGRRAGPSRHLGGVWAASWRHLGGVWAAYGLSGLFKVGPAPARCLRCPTRHRPGIDRFNGDQIAMGNAAPGFKFELKVTRCPPDSQSDPAATRSPMGAPVENT